MEYRNIGKKKFMRQIKLPYLPSDVEARKSDLLTDLWYKSGKETKVKQDQQEIKIQMKNIVIFGAPGSGKGTQSDLLIEHYGLGHISTGDVLRNEIKKGTELGKTAQQFIDKGQLIPDELMISILASVYDSFGRGHKGVIFDGFPRTIPQAEALKKMLDERGDKVAAMIELDVPEGELMTRLIKRGQQSGRADDNEETIKKRLVVYHSQTQPLIEWYKQEGLHHHINGLGTLERIFSDIQKVIDGI